MRLLIAEDELDLAEALTVFFQKNHFSVDAVNDGADAYEYASSGEYDAIILDVMMPKMNGIDVFRRLRAEGIKTPVMMLTAKGMKDDRITGFNAGADDYLPKPFEPDELICRVRAMLRRSDNYRPSALEFGDVTLDPSTGLLACSGRSVRQLVSILLDNAVKYASPDSPITLKLERDRKGVVIRSSNGCDNVDAEDTKMLFDRFYRADKARGSGGFGIGLSIARSIAEAHKGSIKAELTDNNTIEFTVHLK